MKEKIELTFFFYRTIFLDRNASITNNIFTTVQEYPESNYNNERDGGGLTIGYNIGEYGSQSLGYRLEKEI